jgi:peroxiredoxin
MQNFQKNLQKLEAADTQVLGVSMDSPFSNAAWAEKEGIKFPILSDWEGNFTKQLGIYTTQHHARRVTFLLDKEGKVLEMQMDREAIDPTAVVASCERRKLKS